MEEIVVYCDGGARNNGKENSVGGWAVVLKYGEHIKEMYGGEKHATNNQMELTGAIRALQTIKTTHIPVKMYCDSKYVVDGITSWITGWKKKKWKKSDGKPVLNVELWKLLDELNNMQENIEWIWVKGHAGIEGNERVDELANLAMDEVSDND